MSDDGLTPQNDGQDLATGTDSSSLETTMETAENWVAPNTNVYNDPFCLGTGLIGDPADPNSYICPHCFGTGVKH